MDEQDNQQEKHPLQERMEIERANLEPLRNSIESARLRRSEAAGNVIMADKEIALIESKLSNWKRWRQYQAERVGIFERRMKLDREELRSIEDYEGGEE
jgi:hypothetical protein